MELELIDRERETQALLNLLGKGAPALALITGRRRIGKTYLLSKIWEPGQALLYTASRTTSDLNRLQLLRDVERWSGDTLRAEDYPTWRTVFQLLVDVAHARAERGDSAATVFVLDEFQYLAADERGLAEVASELNAVWEREISRSSLPLVVVLSGSAVTMMESLARGGAPLYGRFALQLTLRPFDYWDSAALASFTSLRDRALVYGCFGGTPRYLAAVDVRRSLADNVRELLLSPRGEVRMLVETSLEQEEGLRDINAYVGILRAVADGYTQRNEIAQRAGLKNDQGLRDKLGKLVELGYLEQRTNFDAKPNAPVRYYIADAAFRFYHRFVSPNLSMLERYETNEVWEPIVAPQLDAYMGLEFERIAVQAYDRKHAQHGLPLVKQWGRWEGNDRARRSVEIDIVARLEDNRMMTGAITWGSEQVRPGVHHAHMDMLQRLADAGHAWAHEALEPDALLYYVAAGGFSDAFLEEVELSSHPVVCWGLEDMYTY